MSAGISSVLPSATYAGALTEFWSPAGAGGGGGGSPGVTQIVAGNNITISPGDGEGVVTINSTASGASGVTEILAVGDGIAVSAPTGIVNISNTGVTSLVAGAGIAVSSATGAVTVSSTPNLPPGNITIDGNLTVNGSITPANAGQSWSSRFFTGSAGGGLSTQGWWYTLGRINLPGQNVFNNIMYHCRLAVISTTSGSATFPLDADHNLQVNSGYCGITCTADTDGATGAVCTGVLATASSMTVTWSGFPLGTGRGIAITMLGLSSLGGVS